VAHDDRTQPLRLIFTCWHPALPFPARVALTLRTPAGDAERRYLTGRLRGLRPTSRENFGGVVHPGRLPS
jgi:hypothetical protein